MDWTPRLDSKTSIAVALAAAGVTLATFAHFTPSLVDHRVGQAGDPDAAASERAATWTATGLVGALFLITMDPLVFIMGGGTIAAMSIFHRHANMVNPATSAAAVAASMPAPASTSDQTTGDQYDSYMEAGMY